MEPTDSAPGRSTKPTTTNQDSNNTDKQDLPQQQTLDHPGKEEHLFSDSPEEIKDKPANADPPIDSDFEEDSVDRLTALEEQTYEGKIDLVTASPPEGLGIDPKFLEILVKQGAYNFPCLVTMAAITPVATALTNYGPEVYKQHKSSIRKFIIFGELCQSQNPRPAERTKTTWMPKYITMRRTRKITIVQDEFQWRKVLNMSIPKNVFVDTSSGGSVGKLDQKMVNDTEKPPDPEGRNKLPTTSPYTNVDTPDVPELEYLQHLKYDQLPNLMNQTPTTTTTAQQQNMVTTPLARNHQSMESPSLQPRRAHNLPRPSIDTTQTTRRSSRSTMDTRTTPNLQEASRNSYTTNGQNPTTATPRNLVATPPRVPNRHVPTPGQYTNIPHSPQIPPQIQPHQLPPHPRFANNYAQAPMHQQYPNSLDGSNSMGSQTNPSQRLQQPGIYYSNAQELPKSTIPSKVKWDGTIQGFQNFKYAVEGYYRQVGAGYIFNKTFQRLYKHYGKYNVVNHPDLPPHIRLTIPQVESISSHLYGAIQIASRDSNTARRFLRRHEETQDGIALWIDLLDTQDNDGNRDIHEAKLISVLRTPYYPTYPGGLLAYLDTIADTYSGLDNVGNVFTQHQKKQTLLDNLGHLGSHNYLVSHCRDNFKTFDECYNYLRRKASHEEGMHITHARRKAHHTQVTEPTGTPKNDIESLITACQGMGMDNDDINLLRVANAALQDEYNIPYKAWKLLFNLIGKEKLTEFIKARDEAKRKERLDGTYQKPTQYSKPISETKQEAKANTATAEDDSSASSNDTGNDQELIDLLHTFDFNPTFHANLTTLEYPDNTYFTHLVNTTTYYTMIMDTGADTTIIGEGWYITEVYGPRVNVVGFDTTHARKNNLRMCTAETIIDHPTEGAILIQAHNVIYNPSSKSTLLSEYQLSQGGCQIDSKPKTHQYPDGRKGTLCTKIPHLETPIKLQVRACLITLGNRHPTVEERDTLKPYEITLKETWDPQQYHTTDSPDTHHMTSEAYKLQFEPTILCDPEKGKVDIYHECQALQEVFHDTYQEPPIESFEYSKLDGNTHYSDISPDTFGFPFVKDYMDIESDDTSSVPTLIDLQDDYLDTLPDEISNAEIDHYDPTSYVNLAKQLKKALQPRVTKLKPPDYEKLQPCFAFLPVDVIRKTMDCTTQLAKWCRRLPLQRHWQARFPFLNVHRLSEGVATDTYFANCQAIDGYTCTQVFYGITSHMINVYHMKSESEGPQAYEDFIREEGCPTLLRRDNSKMQTGKDFTNICRYYGVKDAFTEPHHPHQNPAENRAVRWLKQHSQIVMNKTGAPPSVWTDCATWIADIHNIVADESLGNRTPYEKRHGTTPDISAYMLFTFWEKILYHDTEQTYPESKELPGRFLGVAKHSGDALTFVILNDQGQRLTRSVIRSASGETPFGFPNARITHPEFSMTSIPPLLDPAVTPAQPKGG